MNTNLLAAAVLCGTIAAPALARNTDTANGAATVPPATANQQPLTGAVDAPKTTTSGNETATTDAAGVPQGTVGSSTPASDTNATTATKRKHHRRAARR